MYVHNKSTMAVHVLYTCTYMCMKSTKPTCSYKCCRLHQHKKHVYVLKALLRLDFICQHIHLQCTCTYLTPSPLSSVHLSLTSG